MISQLNKILCMNVAFVWEKLYIFNVHFLGTKETHGEICLLSALDDILK